MTDMTSDPHAAAPDEDPLDHVGEVITDPWDDPGQTDWADDRVRDTLDEADAG